jgi:hypothetical protein
MADAYTVFTTYTFPNAYAQDPREQVRPKYFRTNNEDWTEAMYLFRQSADISIDSGTDNQLVLTVSPSDLVQDNHYVIVDNGETGASKLVWFVPPAGVSSSDTITINNTYLADDYTDVSDYDDDITDVSSFRIIVFGAENERLMVDGPNQILNYFADDLEMADDDSDSVATVIGAIEDTLEVITDYTKSTHTAGTEIEEEIIKNEDLDWDNALAVEGFENLLENGGFERWRDVEFTGADSSKDISIPGWKFTINSSTTVSRESTTVDRGTYALKLDSKANSDTVYQEISNYADYQDRWVTLIARVKGTSGRQFKFEIDDGVSATTGSTQTADGDWNTYYIHLQAAAAASELTVKFIRDDGTDSVYYLDNFALYEGRLAKQFSLRTLDRVEEQDDRGSKNLLINGSFEMGWPAGDEAPAGWTFIGLSGAGAQHTGVIGDTLGHYAIKLNPGAVNDGIEQPIGSITPVLNYVKGETVCFSFAALRDSATSSEWAVRIDDGVGTTTMLFDTSDYDSAERINVVHDVDGSATKLDVEIYCTDSDDQEDLYIDACCLNIGSRPIRDAGAPNNSIWQPYVEVFEKSGTVNTDATKLGLERLAYNDFYPLWMDAHISDTATGAIEFELQRNGTKVMEVEIENAASEGFETNALSSANSDQIAMGDTYHVEIDLGVGEECDDPSVHVFGVQLNF